MKNINDDEYLSDYELLIDSIFPLRYQWSINGYLNKEVSYADVTELPSDYKKALKSTHRDEKKIKIINKAVEEIDRDIKEDGEEWARELNMKFMKKTPVDYSIVKINGYGEREFLLQGEAGPSYEGFEENRHKKNPSVEFLKKLTEDYDDLSHSGDIPFEKPIDINIIFYSGLHKNKDISIHANSLKELVDITDDFGVFPLSYRSQLKSAYFGEGWYNPGEDLEWYSGNLLKAFIKDWNEAAEDDPDYWVTDRNKITSKWVSCATIIENHLAYFKSVNISFILDKIGALYDPEELPPTKDDLGLTYPLYFEDDERGLIGPSRADWETSGEDLFPINLVIFKDGNFDIKDITFFEDPEDFLQVMSSSDLINLQDLPNINFNGTKKESLKMLTNFLDAVIDKLKVSTLSDFCKECEKGLKDPQYRWISFILENDDTGDVIYRKTIDMLDLLNQYNINPEIIEALKEIQKPRIPKNIA